MLIWVTEYSQIFSRLKSLSFYPFCFDHVTLNPRKTDSDPPIK